MPRPVTLSAHASRNPSKPVQQPRKRQSQATKASRALATAQRLNQDLALEAKFEEFFQDRENTIITLAKDFSKSETYIRKVLTNGVRYGGKRAVSLKNAIRHELSIKAKEEGEESGLFDIDLSGEEYQHYKDGLSSDEKKRLIEQLEASRELKKHGPRATEKSTSMDAMQTANQIGRVLIDLYERTDVRAFAFFTRGHPDDRSMPCIVDSDGAREFFQDVFESSPLDVVRKFEFWSCTRDKGKKDGNSIDIVRKRLGELVHEGKIKNNKKLEMSWSNYKIDVVHRLGVELAGWPTKVTMQRPSKIPAEDARRIVDNLRTGAIHWVVLTAAQRAEVAAEVEELRESGTGKKPRKQRSDKNVPRGPRKKKNAEESDSDSDNEEEAMSTPASAPRASAPHTPALRTSTPHAGTSAGVCTSAQNPAPRNPASVPAFGSAPTPGFSIGVQPTSTVSMAAGSQLDLDMSRDPFDFTGMDFGPPLNPLPSFATQLGVDGDFPLDPFPSLLSQHTNDNFTDNGNSWRLNTSNREDGWLDASSFANSGASTFNPDSGLYGDFNGPTNTPSFNNAGFNVGDFNGSITTSSFNAGFTVSTHPSTAAPGHTVADSTVTATGSSTSVFSVATNTAEKKRKRISAEGVEKAPRKTRSDKNKPRGPRTKKDGAAGTDADAPPKRKKKKSAAEAAPQV
ncbi:hypothetical protein C8R44DRAFT_725483 [Mycena epipterygia]|nr:hypothetical protein C8R44DRAFT_725483 [Mycena epipterygia]